MTHIASTTAPKVRTAASLADASTQEAAWCKDQLRALAGKRSVTATDLANMSKTLQARKTDGNIVTPCINGPAFFASLTKDLAALTPKDALHIVEFGVGAGEHTDPIFDLIRSAAKDKKIPVGMLIDSQGSREDSPAFYKSFTDAGVQLTFNRGMPKINYWPGKDLLHFEHRKIFAMTNVAYIGGMGVQEGFYNNMQDLMFRITGPAVSQLNLLTIAAMMYRGYKLPPEGPQLDAFLDRCFPKEKATTDGYATRIGFNVPTAKYYPMLNMVKSFLSTTKSHFDVVSPYFGDPAFIKMLTKDAPNVKRELIVPHAPAQGASVYIQRSSYPRLLKAGYDINEFPKKTTLPGPDGTVQNIPAHLHAKLALRDPDTKEGAAMIGSWNADALSIRRDGEIAMEVDSPELAKTLEDKFVVPMEQNSVKPKLPPQPIRGILSGLGRVVGYFT